METLIKKKAPGTALKNEIPNLKIPPHSVEAEQCILGGILLDNSVWDVIGESLGEDDFYRFDHRRLFAVMAKMMRNGAPVDFVTVLEALKSSGFLEEAGGEAYLYELARNTPSVSNISAYAGIVREKSALRRFIGCAGSIAEAAFSWRGGPVEDLADAAEKKIFEISARIKPKSEPRHISDIMDSVSAALVSAYDNKDIVLHPPTGFGALDKLTGGLKPGELYILAARPSMGKTSLALNICTAAAGFSEAPVLVFSLEMGADSLGARVLASAYCAVSLSDMAAGRYGSDDIGALASKAHSFKDLPVFVDDTPSLTPWQMRSTARRWCAKHKGLALIAVDYLQLMSCPHPSGNRTSEVSEISRSLKSLARELNTPVLALSQLNRGVEQRADKRPGLGDLRDSGAIEQDADVVMFLYREEAYNKNTLKKGEAELIVAKNRNGATGCVKLRFDGRFTKFSEY